MSEKDNKDLIRRYFEAFNKGKHDYFEEFIDPSFIDHNPIPGTPPDIEGLKQGHLMVQNAFPDIRVGVDDLISEEDKVVIRFTASGTHENEFMGIPPTGKKVSIMEIRIYRIAGGKIVEHWGLVDQGAMMQQLGLSP